MTDLIKKYSFALKNKLRFSLAFLIIFLAALPSMARISPNAQGQIHDEAMVLSNQGIQALMELRLPSNIAIVIPRSLGGKSIDRYGIDLGNSWGRHKDLLVVIDPNTKQSRLIVSASAQKSISIDQAHYINRQLIAPALQQGNYDKAVYLAGEEIKRLIGNKPITPVIQKSTSKKAAQKTNSFSSLGFFVSILFFFFLYKKLKEFLLNETPVENYSSQMQSGNPFTDNLQRVTTYTNQESVSQVMPPVIEQSAIKRTPFMKQHFFQKKLKPKQAVPDYQPSIPIQRNNKMSAHIHSYAGRYTQTISKNKPDPKYNTRYQTSDRYDDANRYNTDDLFE